MAYGYGMTYSTGMPELTVYSKPGCQQCLATTRHLDKHGLAYKYRDVTTDPAAADIVQLLGYTGLPVITVGDMHWTGYRHDRIEQLAAIGTADDVTALDDAAVAYLTEVTPA